MGLTPGTRRRISSTQSELPRLVPSSQRGVEQRLAQMPGEVIAWQRNAAAVAYLSPSACLDPSTSTTTRGSSTTTVLSERMLIPSYVLETPDSLR